MCCCGKPTVNGTAPVKMTYELPASSYEPRPPALHDRDVLLFDEPGRCGGLDHHSYHFRVVKQYSSLYLLVKHGGGEERIRLFPLDRLDAILAGMDSDSRYWLLSTIHAAHRDGAKDSQETEAYRWRRAAAEKRIKTRKVRGGSAVKVWIDTPVMVAAS
jgi:hypothetical protein